MAIIDKMHKKEEPYVEFIYDSTYDAYKIFAVRDFGKIKAGQAGGHLKLKRGAPDRVATGQVWISANTIVYADSRSRLSSGTFIYGRNSGNGRIVGTSVKLNNSTLENVEMHLQFISENDSLNIENSELQNVVINKTLNKGCNAFIKHSKISNSRFLETLYSDNFAITKSDMKGVVSYGQNLVVTQSKISSNESSGEIVFHNDINVLQSKIFNAHNDSVDILSKEDDILQTNYALDKGCYTVNSNFELDCTDNARISKVKSIEEKVQPIIEKAKSIEKYYK